MHGHNSVQNTVNWPSESKVQVLVVQKVDSTFHWINLYPLDNATGFPNTYPLDSAFLLLNNQGQLPVVQNGGQRYPPDKSLSTG